MHASYRPSRALDLYQATYQADPVTREPREADPDPAPADETECHCAECGHTWTATEGAPCPVCHSEEEQAAKANPVRSIAWIGALVLILSGVVAL